MLDCYDNPIIYILKVLERSSISYVSWKNNHELSDAFSAERDIDIFVPLSHVEAFYDKLNINGWLELENPFLKFMWVQHFYAESNGAFFHIHLYVRPLTGESWLKEYLLPIDSEIINNRIKNKKYGIYVLNSEYQAKLFAVRHLLKNESLFSRYIYKKELKSYGSEWLSIKGGENKIQGGILGVDDIFDFASLQFGEKIKLPSILQARRFRSHCRKYLLMSTPQLLMKKVRLIFMRPIYVCQLKKKKIMPKGGGGIIAITGVDGSGKSTIIKELETKFSGLLVIKKSHLGRPFPSWFEFIRIHLNVLFNKDKNKGSHRSKNVNKTSILRSIFYLLVAFLRYRQAKKCVKWASKGYLVIADRWPTVKRSKMDGPKIIGSTALLETLSRIERDIYGKIPNADIAIVLKVTKEDSLLRNKLREKLEKESDAGIVSRFEENKVIEPLADRVFIYNNHKSVAEARDDLFDLIWRNIASFQENHPANVSEYLGLPGSGKSTILNKLLSTQGGSIAVYGLWDKSLSRFPVKASLLLKGAFLHGLIIDSVRNIVSRNIDNKHMRYRVYLNWIYVIEFIRGNVINKNGVYLDQGLMQLLWSTYFRSRSVPSYSSDASDLLVILDHIGVYTLNVKLLMFDDLVVLERLTARGGNGSVLDGVISTSCSEWMQAKRSLANVVKLINEIQEIDPVRINLARVY